MEEKMFFNEKDVKEAALNLLKGFGENPEREGLKDTPKRVMKAWQEMLCGYNEDPNKHLKLFTEKSTSLTVIRDLNFTSVCEHHLMPFSGKITIGYIPDGQVLGLSKFSRITDIFARRLQLQEKLVQEIYDFLQNGMKPKFLFVYAVATHDCISCRGVNQKESHTETLVASPAEWFGNYTQILNIARSK